MTPKVKKTIESLKKNFPTERPVSFRFRPIKRTCGVTEFNSSEYRITIDSGMQEIAQIDTILHEYAHAYSIDQSCRHEGNWGQVFAELYANWTRIK